MKINSIKITNFRCYYGTNTLSFNSDGKITLIYGDSGYGKSSLLQFFKWMFYDDCDFGQFNDKPLFNISAYNECKTNESFEVSGQIDFDHLGISYRLNKCIIYNFAFKRDNVSKRREDYILQIKGDDNGYHPYNGDIANKINSILPKELSQYFFLDGERARDIVLNSNELRKAIHSLFGLDIYSEALSHVGVNKNAKTTVLGHYNSLIAENTPTIGKMSFADMNEAIQELYGTIETLKEKRKETMSQIAQKSARRDEIFKVLGEVSSKKNLSELINAKRDAIDENNKKIIHLQHNIGTLFYKNYPYLFLAQIASESSSVLRKKNLEYTTSYNNVFDNLKKNLLEEVLQKNTCICGRPLDKASSEYIEKIINIMPPSSHEYEFGQFVSKAKRYIKSARLNTMEYEHLTSDIAALEQQNAQLEEEIQDKLNELKRLDAEKNLVQELENLQLDLKYLESEKANYEGKIAQKKQIYEMSSRKYNEELKNSKISSQYNERLEFFEKLSDLLRLEKDQKELEVKSVLNNCVKDIFKKLTTQTELDTDKIQFINDDFSLRTTYLTGGQLAVDVYSYVIGIIKALQECQMDNNENPIIVDAPFAFTGTTQSEHIFKTLPTISKQTILLTLDLNKIKNLLYETDLYDFYVIKNETQEKARIERGDINDIKF